MAQNELKIPQTLNEFNATKLIFLMGGVRSGTTVFRQMVASHPRIRDYGEIFNSVNPQGYFRYLQEQVATEPRLIFPEHQGKLFLAYLHSKVRDDEVAMMDLKYEHLNLIVEPWQLPFSDPKMLSLIKESKIRVVHLRRSHFYAALSNLIAVRTGRYRVPAEGVSKPFEKSAVAADRDGILWRMKMRKRASDLIDKVLDKSQRLSLDYENLFDAEGEFQLDVLAKLAGFLGVENHFKRTPLLKKVIDEPLSAIISNYEEIRDLESITL